MPFQYRIIIWQLEIISCIKSQFKTKWTCDLFLWDDSISTYCAVFTDKNYRVYNCSRIHLVSGKSLVRRRGLVSTVPAFKPGGPDSISDGVSIFNFYPWDWVCVLCLCSVLSCLWRWPWHADHRFQGGHSLCLCLVFWFTVCNSPYRYLSRGNFSCKSRECVSPILGRVNKRERKKERQERKEREQIAHTTTAVID